MSHDPQTTGNIKSSPQAPQDSPGNHQSNADVDSKKVSRQDIELVQNLIERCLQLYMNKGEVVRTLTTHAKIEPRFTALVWQKLEEENSEFFRAYYIRLKIKKQILLFNHLLEHQSHLMKYSMAPKVPLGPIQNGTHPMPVNNLPIGYPVIQQPPIAATCQPHFDSMGCGLPSCHLVNGIPATGSFHPIRMTAGTDALSSVSEMAVSPASVASNNHFPFTPPEMAGICMDASALDPAAFATDVAGTVDLHLGADGGVGSSRDSLKSLGQLWNFSFSDLTADLTNLGDLGVLGDYHGSPFLPSDSDILLNSPEQDDIVEDYFADTITGPDAATEGDKCSPSDGEKP